MKLIFITSLSAFLFGAIGVTLIVRANDIVRFHRKQHESHRLLRTLFPLDRAWVESPYYEVWVRLLGALMIAVTVLLLFVMIHGLLRGST